MRKAILAIGCGLAATLALAVPVVAHADTPPQGRSVSLTDARTAPDTLVRIPAGQARTYPASAQWGRAYYWTEFQAYTGNGGALSAQAWTDSTHTVVVWRNARKRSVTFDGITVRNHTSAPIMFGGWCS